MRKIVHSAKTSRRVLSVNDRVFARLTKSTPSRPPVRKMLSHLGAGDIGEVDYPVYTCREESASVRQFLFFCAITVVFAQTQKNGGFDVASVKLTGNPNAPGRVQILPGGTLKITNCDLPFIIQQIYGLPEYQVIRGPGVSPNWGNAAYDIDAKTEAPAQDSDVRQMAQRLMAERFKLKVHRDRHDVAVYWLTVDKKGSKIQAAAGGGRGRIELVDKGRIRGNNVTMDRLISVLTRSAGQPVIDKTNIDKPFDFALEWSDGGDGVTAAEANRPSLFTAVREQLGLALEPRKAPIDVLVVDSVLAIPSSN